MAIEPILSSLSLDHVRADFPILARKVYGKPLVYLDNAASAQKPQVVVDAMVSALTETYANVHRGLHFLANASTEKFESARETVRLFFNALSTDTIIFTRSATEAVNLVASSFLAPQIQEGDEIILSIMEHHSNIVPWHFLRERFGAVIRWAPILADGQLDLEAFERLFSKRTKMVAITHMSNVLGTLTPLADIVHIAHQRGVPVLADGSQAAVHLPVDVSALDVDFYICTGHKLYGPTGIGVLYAKSIYLNQMQPFNGGGEMIDTVSLETVTYNTPPARFEAGTPPIVEAIGLAAALHYISDLGRDKVLQHENSLLDYANQRLKEIPGVRIFGEAPQKGALISFSLGDHHAHDVATLIDRQGVAVRAGTHCAQPLLQHFGVSSTCRASFALYNTFEEVDVFVSALFHAQKILG